ncbi:DUF2855 family protein [Parasphingorhabdus sp.]|uniref:DUF2855 family protein n=1 Tax=Parasphingorhabdus sp. TaxID=2709688 RepID=UPI00359482D3
MQSLWVRKDDLAQTRWQESEAPALAEGQILLAVEKYALTANNITYAVVGDGFGYWNFFPTGDDQWGIVPVWGFAKVVASQHADIAVGERVYGYLPMASHLRVTPAHVQDGGFVDGAAHRQGLAIIYNQYHRLGTAEDAFEAERAIFQPLFTTSFLIEHFLRSHDWFGAEALVMTSASSKTSLGLAMVARNLSPAIHRVGLTSTVNKGFVEKSGLYDEVLAYEDLASADADRPTVSVDFAGNGPLLAAIHARWGDNLKFSSLVGATHVEQRGGGQDLQGPKPELFFAPTAAESLMKEIGAAEFRSRVEKQFTEFVAGAGAYLTIEDISGREALQSVYLAMLANEIAPSRGLMCHHQPVGA